MVLLAVAVWALVGALVYRLRARCRRREGWAFRNEVYLNKRHYKWVWDKCRTGKTLADITRNDGWSWLGKYRQDEVSKLCAEAIMKTKSDIQTGVNVTPTCAKKKNGLCDDPVLRGLRPCLNKKKTKCCALDGKSCKYKNAGSLGEDLKKSGQLVRCPTRKQCPDRKIARSYPCLVGDGQCCKTDGLTCKYLPGYPKGGDKPGGKTAWDKLREYAKNRTPKPSTPKPAEPDEQRYAADRGWGTPKPTPAPTSAPTPPPDVGIRVWDGKDFTGNEKTFFVGDYEDLYEWHNRIQSMKIPPGYRVSIFSKTNFSGNWLNHLEADNHGEIDWIAGTVTYSNPGDGMTISSMKVRRRA